MKKTLLFSLLLVTTFLSAQNWMPFNPNDRYKHFLSEDSTFHLSQNLFFGAFKPVLTAQIDTFYVVNQKTIVKFEKGFSLVYLGSGNFSFQGKRQLIKGQIFGDSAFISTDSSVFHTIDSLGFTLSFPHRYYLNDSILIGRNKTHNIIAIVDSFRLANIHGSSDSLVYLTQTVFDKSNINDINHGFNKSNIVISKSHGLYRTINFSNLDSANYYTNVQLNDTILKKEHYNYQLGDQIHKSYDSLYNNLQGWYGYYEISVVDSIYYNNSFKSIRFANYQAFPSGSPTFNFYNKKILTYDTTDILSIVNSCVINKNHLKISFWPFNNPFSIYGFESGVFSKFDGGSFQYISGNSISYDSLNYYLGGLAINDTNTIIGVGEKFYQYHNGESYKKQINYFNINGQSWGFPFNFVTSIEKQKKSRKVEFYPNPTSNQLNIQSNKTFDTIEIRNLRGRLVLKQNFNNQIDVSNLPSGIYFIQLVGDEIISQKIIKN